MSQATDVIEYCLKHGSITAKQAMDDLGCYRLSARVYDIRSFGIVVNKEMITVQNRNGVDCRVAKYTIPNIPDHPLVTLPHSLGHQKRCWREVGQVGGT